MPVPEAAARPSPLPFVLGLVMIAVAFSGIFLLAKTGARTHAVANDPLCGTAVTATSRSAAGNGACQIVGGTIARAKRLRGTPYVAFSSDDGRVSEIALPRATDDDLVRLQRDAKTRAAFELVLGTPVRLVTKSGDFAIDGSEDALHAVGVGLVAAALSYFAAWIAISALIARRIR